MPGFETFSPTVLLAVLRRRLVQRSVARQAPALAELAIGPGSEAAIREQGQQDRRFE